MFTLKRGVLAALLATVFSFVLAAPALATSSDTEIATTGTNGEVFVATSGVNNTSHKVSLRHYAEQDSAAATGIAHAFKAADSSTQKYAVYAGNKSTRERGAVMSGYYLKVTAENSSVQWYELTVATAAPPCNGKTCEIVAPNCHLEELTVPAGVTSVEYSVTAGAGAGDEFTLYENGGELGNLKSLTESLNGSPFTTNLSSGGSGGSVSGKLGVVEGETLYVLAGAGGTRTGGGCYGGGIGQIQSGSEGGGGGGGSFLFDESTLVAAAGGGGGGASNIAGGNGGHPGGNGNGTSTSKEGGKGATASAGGAGGEGSVAGRSGGGPTTSPFNYANGGSPVLNTKHEPMGGGGGGYYAGGSGGSNGGDNAAGSGGGGSDYANPEEANTSVAYDAKRSSSGSGEVGDNGRVVLKYTRPTITPVVTASASVAHPVIAGTTTLTAKVTPTPEDTSPGTVTFQLVNELEVSTKECVATVDATTGEASCNVTEYGAYKYEWVAEYSGTTDSAYAHTDSSSFDVEWVYPNTPKNTSAPLLSGNTEVGDVATSSTGAWNESREEGSEYTLPLHYEYKFYRCHSENFESCEPWPISEGESNEYTLQSGDENEYVVAEVFAINNYNERSEPVLSNYLGPIGNTPAPPASEAPPVNTATPEVTDTTDAGAYEAGDTLKLTPGAWTGNPTPTYSYQWQRCDVEGEDCANISGATEPTYTLTASDVGLTSAPTKLRGVVTATNTVTSTEASALTPNINAIRAALTSVPSISGEAVVGHELTIGNVSAAGDPAPKINYRWWTENGVSSPVPIENPDHTRYEGTTYEVTAADAGLKIYAEVTADNTEYVGGGYFESSTDDTATVPDTAPVDTTAPTITGNGRAGTALSIDDTAVFVGGLPYEFYYQWETCESGGTNCAPISGAGAETFTPPGSLIPLESEPARFARLNVEAENTSGSGHATSNEVELSADPAEFTTTAPTLTGETKEGQVLTVTHYATGGDPTPDVTYSWLRCGTNGANCGAAGGSGNTYTLGSRDVGHTIKAIVNANNSQYRGGALVNEDTAASAVVQAYVPVCGPGTYSETGDTPCNEATPGNSVFTSGATSQTPCTPGYYAEGSGNTICGPARIGYYVAAAEAPTETKCPAGTYSSVTAATQCTNAPTDSYDAGEGNTSPTPCPAGEESAEGASSCAVTPSQPPSEKTAPPAPEKPREEPKPPAPETPHAELLLPHALTLTNSHPFSVRCKLTSGAIKTCAVTAYATGKTAALAVVGQGHVAGTSRAVGVSVLTNRQFFKRLRKAPHGLRLVLRGAFTTAAGQKVEAETTVRVVAARVIILPSTGEFAWESPQLLPAAKRYLRAIRDDFSGARSLSLVGHTDKGAHPGANYALGLERAQAITAFLRHLGVRATIRASSVGQTQPRANEHTNRGQELNRYVAVTLHY